MGCFILAITFVKEFKTMIKSFNRNIKYDSSRSELKTQLSKIIGFSNLKRWEKNNLNRLEIYTMYWNSSIFRRLQNAASNCRAVSNHINSPVFRKRAIDRARAPHDSTRFRWSMHSYLYHFRYVEIKLFVNRKPFFLIFLTTLTWFWESNDIQFIVKFQSSNKIDSIVLFESIFCGFGALMLVFAACEIGHRFSGAYDEIIVTIYRIDWYFLPLDVQRMFLIFHIYAQQPPDFQFFGSISISREQFKQVSE